ncbi:hypothetical protein, variant 4 [Aphanomyces astaci]|uniref:Palmitoyltransferase n=1 Tax=Aphanomyces astaci TaxID=112090 RepID=W4GRC4_APHAT|nr:hypothetical protein, variant 4 [Aphanomyces astaci]ETV81891.1 hypothetical protein, variant 4 [Aphanomyces astaci]|eukprot:XP_009828628.1 hypothetical protein, variant 4 [Aphanomyces astaci]
MMSDEVMPTKSTTTKNYKWAYRVGCPAVKALLFCLLLEIPGSSLRVTHRDKTWEWNWPEIQILLVIVGAATLAYYAVQGSDPGYVTEAMVQTSMESDTLLGVDDDELDLRGTSKAREIDYRKSKIAAMEAALELNNNATSENADASVELSPAPTMDFCTVCQLQPPLRAYHCGFCNRCVATFDHHCFFIGSCVGERNHCRFWWFLALTTVEVYACLGVVHSGFHAATSVQAWIQLNSIALVAALFFYTFAAMAYSLCGFHTFIMLTNSTTRELGKGPDKLPYLRGTRECDLPFSNGLVRNVGGFCCFRAGCRGMNRHEWTPTDWKPVGKIDRNAANICDNLWENQYYSCC